MLPLLRLVASLTAVACIFFLASADVGQTLPAKLFRAHADAVAIQTDGRIVVAGSYIAGYGSGFAVARYASAGQRDTSFGSGGTVTVDPGPNGNAEAFAVAVQPDGKIITAGRNTPDARQARSHYTFMIVRFTKIGALDTSFGSDGKVLTAVGGRLSQAFAVAVEPDGKVVAAGSSGDSESFHIAVVRYTKTGRLDASFGSGGKVLTALAEIDHANAVAIQPDGKIVVAGESYNYAKNSWDFALVRYTADGKLDARFGSGGKVRTSFGANSGERAYGAALQRDGKVVAVGYSNANRGEDFAVARYMRTGKLDSTFGHGGMVLTDVGGGGDRASSVALQQDGKIVVAGKKGIFGGVVARYTTSGQLDPSFGHGGKVLTKNGPRPLDNPTDIAIQSDGKIVVTGWSFSSAGFLLLRYTSSGERDASFG